jgi:hypothetical protein
MQLHPVAIPSACQCFDEMNKREKMEVMIRTWKGALRGKYRIGVEPKTWGSLA